jgi:hypothetical protein
VPTETATPSETPTETATPDEGTPIAYVDIRGIVVTENTPLPWAPLLFGRLSVTAGPEGEFEVSVPAERDASVASGLEALRIIDFNGEEMEVLPGTGAEIYQFAMDRGSELIVNAISRIIPGPMCRSFSEQNGEEVLRFPYTNRYFKQLEVASPLLNTVWSISGTPAPASVFEASPETLEDDYYGFEWPISHFTWTGPDSQERVSAVWKILGKQAEVETLRSEIPFCNEPAQINDCSRVPISLNNRIFEQAVQTVTNLSKGAVKAKKSGRWKPKGKFRNPYLMKRAAQALSNIRDILRALPANQYICSSTPKDPCFNQVFPKDRLYSEFEAILKVKLPKELRFLMKNYPKERKAFLAELAKYPNTFTSCPER